MLLVRVRVDWSPIDGLGIFAAQPIPKGAEVWRFISGFDLDLDPALVQAQPAHFRDYLLRYGYVDRRLGRCILCSDEARFINHNDTPNLRSDCDLDRYGIDIATRHPCGRRARRGLSSDRSGRNVLRGMDV